MTDLSTNLIDEGSYQNRGLDTQQEESTLVSIKLYDIDEAIIKYMNDVIQPTIQYSDSAVKVPVLYANPERWKSIRVDGVLRSNDDKLQVPLIVLKRNSFSKNYLNNPINKYLERDFSSTRWNSRNKYDRFAIQNNIIPSKRYVSVVYPDYYDVEYECVIWTDYQEHMNSLIEQISFEIENYWGEQNKFRFKTSVEEYTNEVDLPESDDRIVRSTFTMTVKAYLLPENYIDTYDQPSTTSKTRFTVKKVVFEERELNGFNSVAIERVVQETLEAGIFVLEGNAQSAYPNYDLTTTIVLELRDANGNAVPAGVVVGVTGSIGDGTVYPV